MGPDFRGAVTTAFRFTKTTCIPAAFKGCEVWFVRQAYNNATKFHGVLQVDPATGWDYGDISTRPA